MTSLRNAQKLFLSFWSAFTLLFLAVAAAPVEAQTGAVTGFVWEDADGDGLREAGEPGLEYVSLQLIVFDSVTGNPNVLMTRLTDASGAYAFDYLPADDYVVYLEEYTLPDNYTQTYDPDGIAPANETTVQLAAGQVVSNIDFGYIGPGAITGTIWDDLDGDGLREAGEPGIEFVNVQLIVFDEFGTPSVLIQRTTGADGTYAFDYIPPDDYTIYVEEYTVPTNYTQTYDPDGIAPGNETTVQLAAGQFVAGIDFGYIGPGAITGTIWDDLDGDGLREAGEPGIEFVNVQLIVFDEFGTSNVLIQRTTGADGIYAFDYIPPDDYTIYVEEYTVPTNYTQTYDPDGIAPGNETTVQLAAGQFVAGIDFGYIGPGAITGTIWDDLDGDGLREAGEPGIEYVNVELIVFDEIGAPQVLIQRTTGADGTYAFDYIPPDDYIVFVDEFTLSADYAQTYDPDGVAPGSEAAISLAAGQFVEADFGYQVDPLLVGLLGYWPLEGYNGTYAIDLTTNANDGTILGNPVFETGVAGNALSFDGTGDAISFAYEPLFATPYRLTLSAWMKHSPSSGWRSLIDARDSTADGYDLYLNPNGHAFFRLNSLTLTGSTALDDGQWHHVAAVYDGTDMTLYVDGQADVSLSAGAQTISVTNPLRIGENYALGNSFFAGTLDDVRIYDRGLPVEDIEALFVFGGGVLPPPADINAGLAAHWTFDDGSGSVAADATGNGFDGTVLGALWDTGTIGGALNFDGAGDSVTCPAGSPLDAPAAVSIAAWINHSAASGWHSIVDKRDGGQDGYDLYINGASRLYARVDTATLTGSIVADGTWRHVAMVYDGNVLSLYVDGVLDVSSTVGALGIDTTASLLIGENWALGNSYFTGKMDDVRIYDRALTGEEVSDLYDLGGQ